ncbi:hypothetical protein [Bacillus sp. BP-3]|uniref:hypothetical protein n=1 Tax=Bacillus sp. BP-3 TaxID=3022773 RepID=UPI00232AFC1E|nr:hypothetical protein [Bacillus sp. BP-3]
MISFLGVAHHHHIEVQPRYTRISAVPQLDLDSLFMEFKEILKKDKEFLEIKERIWPEGFTNESDKENFEE